MTLTLDRGNVIPGGGMAAERNLDRGGIEWSQNTADCRVGWCSSQRHAECIPQFGKCSSMKLWIVR
jgi:hypothetical protein